MKPHKSKTHDSNAGKLSQRIEQHRRQSEAFFKERHVRWDTLQTRVLDELNGIAKNIEAWDEVQHDLEQRHAEVRNERQRLERDRVEMEERSSALDEQQCEIEKNRKRIQEELELQRAELGAVEISQQDELKAQIESLQRQLQELEPRPSDEIDYQELRQQMETAVEQSRTLERQIEELKAQRQDRPVAAASIVFDWEAQKARMMAGGDALPPADQLTVNKAIEATDRIVAEKEQEVAELRERLEQLTSGDQSSEAAPSCDFDNNGIIQEERERLKQLQQELRDKAREAEVAIAVERAENARAQAKLERKTRELEDQARMLAKYEKDHSSTGRRWLDHLGLNKKDDE